MRDTGFDLLSYGAAVERMMVAWHSYTGEVLRQSTDVGSAREHFVTRILKGILPKSVVVGSGEIVDGAGRRSGQQDVIIYRSDFPVIASLTPINTYMIEGVIACIEVKSDLSTGAPNNLRSAFRRLLSVRPLRKQALARDGSVEEIKKLQRASATKLYVVGYKGWKGQEAFLKHYVAAAAEVSWLGVPDLVCQPELCVVLDDGFLISEWSGKIEGLLMFSDCPYAVLLHHLLKAVMVNTGGATIRVEGIDAGMSYDLGRYLNFRPPGPVKRLKLGREGAGADGRRGRDEGRVR